MALYPIADPELIAPSRRRPACAAQGSAQLDQALIARVMRRDELALSMLYERFGNLAFAIAMRITQDRPLAEEVVQDVFHGVWRSAGSFQPGGNVTAWIVGIARHRAIDATRARGFRARASEQRLDPALELVAEQQIDEQVERQLIGEQVRTAMLQLHPAQREALGLAYYAGMSHSEIATCTGTPVGTVKARLRLGLLQLRRRLATHP